MTPEHFKKQIKRLQDEYGAQYYTAARNQLIWAEVRRMDDAAFTRVISRAILSCRQAPMMPDLSKAMFEDREAHGGGPRAFTGYPEHDFDPETPLQVMRRCLRANGRDSWEFQCMAKVFAAHAEQVIREQEQEVTA